MIKYIATILVLCFGCSDEPKFGLFEVSPYENKAAIENAGGLWASEDVPILVIDTIIDFRLFSYKFFYQFDSYHDAEPLYKIWEVDVYDTTAFLKYVVNRLDNIIILDKIDWQPEEDSFYKGIWKDKEGRQFRMFVYARENGVSNMSINYRYDGQPW